MKKIPSKNQSHSYKSPKKKENRNSVDIEGICSRLNQIIKRSNEIDEKLSKMEKKSSKDDHASTSNSTNFSPFKGSTSPNPNTSSTKKAEKTVNFRLSMNDQSYGDQSITHDSYISQNSLLHISNSNNTHNINNSISSNQQISINDLYAIVLELKQQIGQVIVNQNEMREEIKQIRMKMI